MDNKSLKRLAVDFLVEVLLKIGAFNEDTSRSLYSKCVSLRKKLKDLQENI